MRDILAVLLLCGLAFAQDVPRAEIFVGYSYINADTNGLTSRLNMNGADVSFVANLNQWSGAETNFSTYFKRLSIAGVGVSLHDYNLLFGPRLHYKWAFAHALVGLDDFGGSALGSSTTNGAVGGAVGGGAIFKIAKRIGLEGGGDYLFTRHNLLGGSAITQNHVRAFAGIVLTLGSVGASAEQTQQPAPTPAPARSPRPAPAPRPTGAGLKIDALGIIVTLGRNQGAEITEVAPNGIAVLAGLHPGDVINAVDGKPVKTPMELAAEVSSRAAGDKVRLGYSLHGRWQAETVVLLGAVR
jgi:PDZ domain